MVSQVFIILKRTGDLIGIQRVFEDKEEAEDFLAKIRCNATSKIQALTGIYNEFFLDGPVEITRKGTVIKWYNRNGEEFDPLEEDF